MSLSPDGSLWESAQRAVIAGDVSALERLLRDHPELQKAQPPPYVPSGPWPRYDADARATIVREHHFETYAAFADHVTAARREDSAVARFEAGVEAVITGERATLQRMLRDDRRLIHARSARLHRATLLHYLGANGVEGFRQKTPPNAVAIANLLLDAGAEVDAVADMYGGSTALGLVATSIHPWLAGVQHALLETLLQRGATIDGPGAGSAVNACLASGRGEAALLLAGKGARLDLEGAAGVGRLDVVQQAFDAAGRLTGATTEQLLSGFAWACEFGRTVVVEFLLSQGVALDAPLRHHGQTGLHWAAYGGHAEVVRLLLRRGAPVNAVEQTFGGTPLGWAVYGWGERPQEGDRGHYTATVALLVAAGGTLAQEWLKEEERGIPLERMLQADPGMRAALGPAWPL
jgi:ankyrin repeat protein